MQIEHEIEIRELVRAIAEWKDARGKLTEAAAQIARNPQKTFMEGKNPTSEIVELRKRIVEGNATCEAKKIKLRELLKEILAGFRAAADRFHAERYRLRIDAAEGLRSFLQNWNALAPANDFDLDAVVSFNALVSSIEPIAVEGGESALPRANESLHPPRRPGWDSGLVGAGKVEAVLERMAEILST